MPLNLPITLNHIIILFTIIISPTLQWDYKQNGADWKTTQQHDCGINVSLVQQSPIDFLSNTAIPQPNIFVFYPQYKATQSTFSTPNFIPTYTPTTTQTFGQLFSLIPSAVHYQNKGLAKKIQFHLPAQHLMKGDRADVQMQIHHQIPQTEFQVSYRNATIVSVFFNVTTDGSSSTVLNFINNQSTSAVDLSELLNEKYPFTRDMYSYQGTKTYPDCDVFSVWYMSDTVEKISKAQHDFLQGKIDTTGAPNGNYRVVNEKKGLILYKHAAWVQKSGNDKVERDL